MVSRTTVIFAILAFTIVNMAGLFSGRAIGDIWLTSMLAMVIFAIVGFLIGWAFESLLKENLKQEEALMFSDYLRQHPDATVIQELPDASAGGDAKKAAG